MSIQLLLDGDWVTYTAGFAGQKTVYLAPHLSYEEFKNMTEIKETARAQNDGEADTGPIYSRTICDPLDHVLHSAKKMIETQITAAEEHLGKPVTLRIYLDGDGNFRNRIGTIRPYKGNRTASRPVYFQDIKDYLLGNWDAELVYDQEADDAMAIAHTENTMRGDVSVICAVDKDMLQVPGYHLNPNKGWTKVGERGAIMRQYVQAATGDSVDNIGGAYKVGPVKAKAVYKKLDYENEQGLWEALVRLYEESMEKYGVETYGGLTAEEAALENMRLIYLRRREGELWMPPNERY